MLKFSCKVERHLRDKFPGYENLPYTFPKEKKLIHLVFDVSILSILSYKEILDEIMIQWVISKDELTHNLFFQH